MNEYDTNAYDALPDSVTEVFGEEATAERAYDLLTVDVPTASWIAALEIARDKLGLTYFDWLSAVDEPGTGFRVCAHVASVDRGNVRRLLLRTTVPHAAATLPSAVEVYAGAGWHERETYEMFGVTFTGHPHLVHLLLPENFEGHPLRKDFVLAARVAKAWPGAKEPGESHDPHAPKRRQMLPPGVPDPNEWGPLKGQLPPAPTRPARAGAADRPARRTRTAADGSAGQPEATPPPRRTRTAAEGTASQAPTDPSAPVRRSRTAAEGSASQAPTDPSAPVRRARTASAGSASRRAETPAEPGTAEESAQADAAPTPPAAPRRARSASAGSASQREGAAEAAPQAPAPTPRTRSSDAPWHHARPAFDEEPTAPQAAPAESGAAGPETGAAEAPTPQVEAPAPPPPAQGGAEADAPPAGQEADAAPAGQEADAAPAGQEADAAPAGQEADAAPAQGGAGADEPDGPPAQGEPDVPRAAPGGEPTTPPTDPAGGDPA
ncbi:NADH-quinone oxidoreductase subunit C [Streptomyces sp. NPDC051921]|uniref:NADH-quinone oxidoreductase subunit C n=1 Tax=Streptomyces sp. NPDC051921 TaxID=3155806 RepID=UPI00341C268F